MNTATEKYIKRHLLCVAIAQRNTAVIKETVNTNPKLLVEIINEYKEDCCNYEKCCGSEDKVSLSLVTDEIIYISNIIGEYFDKNMEQFNKQFDTKYHIYVTLSKDKFHSTFIIQNLYCLLLREEYLAMVPLINRYVSIQLNIKNLKKFIIKLEEVNEYKKKYNILFDATRKAKLYCNIPVLFDETNKDVGYINRYISDSLKYSNYSSKLSDIISNNLSVISQENLLGFIEYETLIKGIENIFSHFLTCTHFKNIIRKYLITCIDSM